MKWKSLESTRKFSALDIAHNQEIASLKSQNVSLEETKSLLHEARRFIEVSEFAEGYMEWKSLECPRRRSIVVLSPFWIPIRTGRGS